MIRSFKAEYVLPSDLSLVALQVLGIFFGAKASKKPYETKSAAKPEVILSREQTILEMIRTNGKTTRKEVMSAFKISDSTADRLLSGMESKGLVKKEGQFKSICYVAVGGEVIGSPHPSPLPKGEREENTVQNTAHLRLISSFH